jgi:hypothetical protein
MLLKKDVHIKEHGVVLIIIIYQQMHIKYVNVYTFYVYLVVYISYYNRSAGNE